MEKYRYLVVFICISEMKLWRQHGHYTNIINCVALCNWSLSAFEQFSCISQEEEEGFHGAWSTNSKDALIIFIFAQQAGVPHRRSTTVLFRYVSLQRSVPLVCNLCTTCVRTSVEKDIMVSVHCYCKNRIYGCNNYIYMLCVQ